jgi:hypothetical protein
LERRLISASSSLIGASNAAKLSISSLHHWRRADNLPRKG